MSEFASEIQFASCTSPWPVDLQRFYPTAQSPTKVLAIGIAKAAEAQAAEIFLGSDDGATVWVNGNKLFESTDSRSYRERQNKIPCELAAGLNLIVLRIEQTGDRWMFGVQIDSTDSWPAAVEFEPLN